MNNHGQSMGGVILPDMLRWLWREPAGGHRSDRHCRAVVPRRRARTRRQPAPAATARYHTRLRPPERSRRHFGHKEAQESKVVGGNLHRAYRRADGSKVGRDTVGAPSGCCDESC